MGCRCPQQTVCDTPRQGKQRQNYLFRSGLQSIWATREARFRLCCPENRFSDPAAASFRLLALHLPLPLAFMMLRSALARDCSGRSAPQLLWGVTAQHTNTTASTPGCCAEAPGSTLTMTIRVSTDSEQADSIRLQANLLTLQKAQKVSLEMRSGPAPHSRSVQSARY